MGKNCKKYFIENDFFFEQIISKSIDKLTSINIFLQGGEFNFNKIHAFLI